MGVADIQGKLRVAVGRVKDHASIGKAMICNNKKWLSDIEIAVVRATGHENNGPVDDDMHQILFLVSNTNNCPSSMSIPFLAERISRRLSKTRDPLVALKTLLLIHRLLRGGNRCFEHQLRCAYISGHLQITSSRLGPTNPSSSSLSFNFLHKYAAYLEERIQWLINQSGKLEPAAAYNYNNNHDKSSIHIIFRNLPKCQVFIDKVLDCWPVSNNSKNICEAAAIAMAMSNTLKESFQVYMTYCEGVAALVNMLFDLTTPARDLTFQILKRASQQTQELHNLYENCKRLIQNNKLEYPMVQIITMDHVLTLENLISSTYRTTLNYNKFTGSKPISSHIERDDEDDGITSDFSTLQLETKISKVWVLFDDETHC